MLKSILRIFIAILMAINPQLPGMLDLGKIPQGKTIDVENDFVLKWEDDFDGTELDTDKWRFSWWITERKGGYWHEDMVSVKDGNLVIRAEYLEEPLENYYLDSGVKMPEYKPGWYTGCVTTRDKYEHVFFLPQPVCGVRSG